MLKLKTVGCYLMEVLNTIMFKIITYRIAVSVGNRIHPTSEEVGFHAKGVS